MPRAKEKDLVYVLKEPGVVQAGAGGGGCVSVPDDAGGRVFRHCQEGREHWDELLELLAVLSSRYAK